MSAVDEIMQQIPLSQLASQLGTDEQTAGAAMQQAIPALLGGMEANAQDPAGAASLEGALSDHSAGLIDGGVDLAEVDPADGQKIVGNIFGDQTDGVARTLGGLGGADQSDLMKKLLPILAPIVMSYVVKRIGGGGTSAGGGAGGGLLGSILGGGSAAGSGGSGLSDILGGLLGGSASSPPQGTPQKSSGHAMIDILGGMLGGGRR